MAKQTFTTGQVLTAAQMTSLQQTAMGGGSATAKTASYVLVSADAGTTVAMNSAGATTITVNTGLFAAGDTVFIQNLGAGACTVTAGTATVATAGSLILPQNDAGILYFTATGAAIFYDYIQTGAVSPLTTKGDVYTFSTSDARLGVGANNTVLTADSAEATGLKWATPSSGGMTLISETVASALSSLSFSSLGSYKQLLLVWSGIKHSTSSTTFGIRLNNDSTSNYIGQNLWYGGGFDVSTFTNTQLNNSGMACFGVNCTGGGADSANGWLMIDNYTSTSKYKTYSLFNLFRNASDGAGVARGGFTIAYYNSTSAITSLDVVRTAGSATFTNDTNTTIRLYGVS